MGTNIPYVKGKVLEVTGGCTECSLGCQNCWARKEVWRMAHNPLLGDKWQGLVKKTSEGLRWTGRIKLFEKALEIPLKRKKPTTYFVDSKADLFHEKVPFEFIKEVFLATWQAPQHAYLFLTKRPKRILAYREWGKKQGSVLIHERQPKPKHYLGVTVCVPEEKSKIDILRQIPAAHRWISFEPLLADMGELDLTGISWVVLGGESGAGARPMHPDWARSVRDQCKAAGVPFFFKQWGAWRKISRKDKDAAQRDDGSKTRTLCQNGHTTEIGVVPDGPVRMIRVGKKRAGRLLDGKIYEEFPK